MTCIASASTTAAISATDPMTYLCGGTANFTGTLTCLHQVFVFDQNSRQYASLHEERNYLTIEKHLLSLWQDIEGHGDERTPLTTIFYHGKDLIEAKMSSTLAIK